MLSETDIFGLVSQHGKIEYSRRLGGMDTDVMQLESPGSLTQHLELLTTLVRCWATQVVGKGEAEEGGG